VLVEPRKAARVVKELINEEPMFVWLPQYGEDDEDRDYLRNEKPDCVTWVVSQSSEARLDEDDPLGSVCAVRRPRIAARFASPLGLRTDDPFGRVWLSPRGRVLAQSQAWGRENKHSEEKTVSGVRLLSSRSLLKSVLTRSNLDLLILVDLQRYERDYGPHSDGKFTHTIAVIRVTKSLDIEYYKGRINHLHRPRD